MALSSCAVGIMAQEGHSKGISGAATQEAPEPWMERQESKTRPRYSIAPTLSDLLWVPTSKQPCWRWWESGIAGWERSRICSGCGWTSSSGKVSPQGSLLWRGSGDEQSGSCWWPRAEGCPPALGISVLGSAPGRKTNGMWARTARERFFQQLFLSVTCYKFMLSLRS